MRHRRLHSGLTALLVVCLLATALAAQAQTGEAMYHRARADYKWLMAHSQAQKIYHNWQNLADLFARVYTAEPNGPMAAHALYWKGRVLGQAYEHFKRSNDLNEAVDIFRRLTNHFPDSRLADDAQFRMGELFELAGNPKQAYLEYLRLTVNYPKGDMVGRAKARLDHLERAIAPIQAEAVRAAPSRPPAKAAPDDGSSLSTVSEIRHWSTRTYTRVVVSLDRPVPYKSHLLRRNTKAGKPRRLYLDLSGARLAPKVRETVPIGDGLLVQARAGQYDADTVRMVLDTRDLSSYKVFTLDNPFRIVVDCFGPLAKRSPTRRSTLSKAERRVPRGQARTRPPEVGLAAALGLKVRRVVLDPGHGGRDQGAAYRGLKEKDVTLDVAKRTAPILKKLLGCQVLLTRTSDTSVPLEARTAYANTHDADLFVSIHVNAAPSHRLHGIETYFLNLASDEESMRVAARENATTTRSINDLQVILNDLMLNSKINESNRLARQVHQGIIGKMRRSYAVRDLKVKQAPFYVLIGARMPAILVEVGFITNPTEHRRLGSAGYRDLLAQALAEGIAEYAKQLKKARR